MSKKDDLDDPPGMRNGRSLPAQLDGSPGIAGNSSITYQVRGGSEMPGTYIFVAFALVMTGVTIGILGMVVLGIKRDDRPGGFPVRTDDRAARAARRVIGVGSR
jgi:hypothetical protein